VRASRAALLTSSDFPHRTGHTLVVMFKLARQVDGVTFLTIADAWFFPLNIVTVIDMGNAGLMLAQAEG